MPLRFLGRICGDAVGSAARRFHVVRPAPRGEGFLRRGLQRGRRLRAEAAEQHRARRRETRPRPLGAKEKNLGCLPCLERVNYVLKFPAEPAAIDEFAAEKALKEDAMKWRFEELWIIEHGSKYKHNEWRKAWLYDKYKKCAQDVDKRNTEGGGAAFGTDQFWDETEQEFRSRRHRELED
ncbi:uncharacterized protein LOC123447491 isoform X2 [Hordeum vulgare subsp. vulgare]|uniref:uncharacterized protein LOC123447491 isoform X2 n=1 Tax=Hordeum vulgare subsp. vulgare TaxID=112509 RepID=UPI001D1A52A5|nr:uncharacterized protein LOC123447491 isoform X2 [Hordeum vulgare subsp. vulgare]